jgi:hypothetical protein
MNEKIPQNNQAELSPEQTEEDRLELESYLAANPEPITETEKIPYGEELAEQMEKIFSDFENDFPLSELIAIETEEEAMASDFRKQAYAANILLCAFFKKIAKETDISSQELAQLDERKRAISMAIGIINVSGINRHE